MTHIDNIAELKNKILNPRALLDTLKLSAKKSWGQNFLRDTHVLKLIADEAARDRLPILEMGAGLGALTVHIADTGLPLYSIERDRDLILFLKESFKPIKHVSIIEDNALTIDFSSLIEDKPFNLTGNLPYHITGPLLMRAFQSARQLKRAVFMIQREVAERLIAKPREKERSSLSIWAELGGKAYKIKDLSPEAFFPQPRVWSTVIGIEFNNNGPLQQFDFEHIEKILRQAFGQRRKMLRNSLQPLFKKQTEELLQKSNISPTSRAEELTGLQWEQLIETSLLY